MLYTQTVESATLELLKQLMTIPELNKFVLAGGTNLSLRLGHRISVDLDLFTNEPFDITLVKQSIHDHFNDKAIRLDETKQSLWYLINGVKTDIILHQYPYIAPVMKDCGIRLLSIPDIIPMKLGAAGRGAKKDFGDIAELLDTYSIAEMMTFYKEKYSSDDIGYILRSLVYFDDAESHTDPVSVKKVIWPQIKSKIESAVKNYATKRTG